MVSLKQIGSVILYMLYFSEYAKWWAPVVEDIVVDKNKGKKQTGSQKPKESQVIIISSLNQLKIVHYQSLLFKI